MTRQPESAATRSAAGEVRAEGAWVRWVGPLAAVPDAPVVRWACDAPGLADALARDEPSAVDPWVRRLAMPAPLLDALADRCVARAGEASLAFARGQAFVSPAWQAALVRACLRAGRAERENPARGALECILALDAGELVEDYCALPDGGAVALCRRQDEREPDAPVSLVWITSKGEIRRERFASLGLYSLAMPLEAPAHSVAVVGQYRGALALWVFDARGARLAEGRWRVDDSLSVTPEYLFSWHQGALWLHAGAGHFRLGVAARAEPALAVQGAAEPLMAERREFVHRSFVRAQGGWVLLGLREAPYWYHLARGEERAVGCSAMSLACQTPEGVVLVGSRDDGAVVTTPEQPRGRRVADGDFWDAGYNERHVWLEKSASGGWVVLERGSFARVAEHARGVLAREGWIAGDGLVLEGQLVARLRRALPGHSAEWTTGGVRDGARHWVTEAGQVVVLEPDAPRIVARRPFPSTRHPVTVARGIAACVHEGVWGVDGEGGLAYRVEQGALGTSREWPLSCAHATGLVLLDYTARRALWRWSVEDAEARSAEGGGRGRAAASVTLAEAARVVHRDERLCGHALDNHEPCAPGYVSVREELLGVRATYEANNDTGRAPALEVLAGSHATLIGCTLAEGPLRVDGTSAVIVFDCDERGGAAQVEPGGRVVRVG